MTPKDFDKDGKRIKKRNEEANSNEHSDEEINYNSEASSNEEFNYLPEEKK